MKRHEKVVVNRLSAIAVQTGPITDPKQLRSDLRTLLRAFAERLTNVEALDACRVEVRKEDPPEAGGDRGVGAGAEGAKAPQPSEATQGGAP